MQTLITWEAKARGSLVQGQLELWFQPLSQENKTTTTTNPKREKKCKMKLLVIYEYYLRLSKPSKDSSQTSVDTEVEKNEQYLHYDPQAI